MQIDYEDFLSRERSKRQREGFRIKGVISSQMDTLRGACLGDRVFKLPYPLIGHPHGENQNEVSAAA